MKCSIGIPELVKVCGACPYSKEGLCDYPYHQKASLEDIKKITKRLGGG